MKKEVEMTGKKEKRKNGKKVSKDKKKEEKKTLGHHKESISFNLTSTKPCYFQ